MMKPPPWYQHYISVPQYSDPTVVTSLSLAGMHVQTDLESYGMGLLEGL